MNQLRRDKSFLTHLIVYSAVNLLLFIINIATSPDNLWFYWPLLGWGIGIIGHAYGVCSGQRKVT